MKIFNADTNGLGFKHCALLISAGGLFLWVSLNAPIAATGAEEMGKAFATPQAAVSALSLAVDSHDVSLLREIFGPDFQELKNPDRVQATNELEAFASALDETHQLIRESDTNFELEV